MNLLLSPPTIESVNFAILQPFMAKRLQIIHAPLDSIHAPLTTEGWIVADNCPKALDGNLSLKLGCTGAKLSIDLSFPIDIESMDSKSAILKTAGGMLLMIKLI